MNTETGINTHSRGEKVLVLLSASLILFCVLGFNLTVLYQDFLTAFGESKAATSLIQSVNFGAMYCGSTIAGIIVDRYGSRRAGLLAGTAFSVAFVISYFATSVVYLTFSLGILAGTGVCIAHVACTSCIGIYFEAKAKFYALSVAYMGSGVGSVVFTIFFNYLSGEYGWRGCLLIIGGIMGNLVPFFLILTPTTQSKSTSYASTNSHSFSLTFNKMKTLLKNKEFVFVSSGLAIAIGSINSIVTSLTDILATVRLSREDIVTLLIWMQISSVTFRTLSGFCKKIPHLSVISLPTVYATIGCVAFALFSSAWTYQQYVMLVSLFGVTLGGLVVSMSLTVTKLLDQKLYSVGFGTLMTIVGISCVSIGPIIGHIRDETGSYNVPLYVDAALMAGAVVLLFICLVKRTFVKKKEETSQSDVYTIEISS